jgi:hypothetical protein
MQPRYVLAGLGALGAAIWGALVLTSIRRPTDTAVFVLTAPVPRDPPPDLAGPDTVTLDARSATAWTRFDLAHHRVAGPGEPWDLAVRRHRFIVNGGEGFGGTAGVVRTDQPFAAVTEAPANGYAASRVTPNGDSMNAALDRWYTYGFFSHLLEPGPATFVLRTADRRYAKLRILSYYCPGPEAGCMTIEYVYQGDGGRRF